MRLNQGKYKFFIYVMKRKKTQNSSVNVEEWIKKTDEYIKSMMKKYPLLKLKDDGKEEINSSS